MWKPLRFTTLWAFKAYYRDRFIFTSNDLEAWSNISLFLAVIIAFIMLSSSTLYVSSDPSVTIISALWKSEVKYIMTLISHSKKLGQHLLGKIKEINPV
jgi:hypothetical protein